MRDAKLVQRWGMTLAVAVSVACGSPAPAPPTSGSGGRAATPAGGSGGGGAGGGTTASGGAAGTAGTGGSATGGASAIPSGGAGGGPTATGGQLGGSGDGAAGATTADAGPAGETNPATPSVGGKVLIYTHSTGFRHTSIEAEAEAMRKALSEEGFTPEVSSSPDRFTTAGLAGLRGIVLISTTGKPLGDPGIAAIAALDEFVQGGGALIGYHAASSTFYEPTAAYTKVIGGKFVNHPGNVRETMCYPEGTHAAAAKLPASFKTRDEIYVFDNYRATDNQVVLRCAALTGPDRLPIAWFRSEGKGRVFYSALGHNAEDFAPDALLMRAHFLPGALWALGK
jgi:uncharacterized protein